MSEGRAAPAVPLPCPCAAPFPSIQCMQPHPTSLPLHCTPPCRERARLRREKGLVDVVDEEVDDTVLGKCSLGPACTKDPSGHLVRQSHSERIHIQCSAGCSLWYHQPCWRKERVVVGVNGAEAELTGREYKWGGSEAKRCVAAGCQGLIVYAEGPNKYKYIDTREDKAKHPQCEAAAGEARRAKDRRWAPQRDKRKGGKRAEVAAGGKAREAAAEGAPQQEEAAVAPVGWEEEAAAKEEAAVQARPASSRPEPQPQPIRALPDDAMLRVSHAVGIACAALVHSLLAGLLSLGGWVHATLLHCTTARVCFGVLQQSSCAPLQPIQRGGEEEDALQVQKGAHGRRDKGKGPAVADIIYEDHKASQVSVHWVLLGASFLGCTYPVVCALQA